MMRRFHIFIFLFLCLALPAAGLLFAPLAAAQITTVTGTITDPQGIPYSGATLKAQLVVGGSPATGQPTVTVSNEAQCISASAGHAPCQVVFQTTQGPVTLDQTGSFTLNLQDNNLITPIATQWLITVTTPGNPPPIGTGPQSFSVLNSITGASESISAVMSAQAPKLGQGPLSGIHSGTETFTGAITCTIVNRIACISPSNPQLWSGTDIGGWINSVITAGRNRVWIADGTYNFATTITVSSPIIIEGGGNGTVLNYTGSGTAVNFTLSQPNVGGNGLYNLRLSGPAGSTVGISLGNSTANQNPFSEFDHVLIQGFGKGMDFHDTCGFVTVRSSSLYANTQNLVYENTASAERITFIDSQLNSPTTWANGGMFLNGGASTYTDVIGGSIDYGQVIVGSGNVLDFSQTYFEDDFTHTAGSNVIFMNSGSIVSLNNTKLFYSKAGTTDYFLGGDGTLTVSGGYYNSNGSSGSNVFTLASGTLNLGAAPNLVGFPGIYTLTGTAAVGPLNAGSLNMSANCSSSASPAVCGSAAAGSVTIAAGATTKTVNTTAVTANSQIFVMEDDSLGTKLGVTCNTSILASPPEVTARVAATSFTITTSAAPVTNPACYSYLVVN